MNKRIYITHDDDVTLKEAIISVHAVIVVAKDAKPGEAFTLSNGIGVEYAVSKQPTFRVWKIEKEKQ